MAQIPFLKMHGLGNDFVVIDNRKGNVPALNWAKLADRHFGIGCDQVVVLEKSARANVFMRIYNANGGEVESCGNASRCVAWLLRSEKPGVRMAKAFTIETLAGVIEAHVKGVDAITIDMGAPRFAWDQIPLKEQKDTVHLKIMKGPLSDPVAVSMGNPHMVFFVPDIGAIPLHELGPELESHPLFPSRVNVGIAQIVQSEVDPGAGQLLGSPPPLAGERIKERGAPNDGLSVGLPPTPTLPRKGGGNIIKLRVWERGSGLTLACGTGACAALAAAHVRGLTGRRAEVKLPGGPLTIEWREDDDHVLMTGPAAITFEGEFDPAEYGA